MGRPTCTVDRCGQPNDARGLCNKHYKRWRRRAPEGSTRQWGSPEDRFWPRVDRRSSGCWTWTGLIGTRGYGKMTVNRRTELVHRVSYRLAYGAIPSGLFVCHHCDNRRCVRPDHLFLSDHAGNMADMTAKLRQARHERSPWSKLTKEAVISLRERYAAGGVLVRELAAEFGVSEHTLYRAIIGKSWRGIPALPGGVRDAETRIRDRRYEHHYNAKLTREAVTVIRARYATGGVLMRELAAAFGVCTATVCLAVNGKTWAAVSPLPSHELVEEVA